MARLGAYLHNHPLRAGLLRDPSATDWTSHRFRSGYKRSSAWAAVEARRLVMITGAWLLRRQVNELVAALTISAPSASHLLRGAERLLTEALAVADEARRRA